jgi:N-succinyldiaminopimelate aminotransferase
VPRYPTLDQHLGQLGGSVFSSLAPRIARLDGEVYPLHIGDTWLEPDPGLSWRDANGTGSERPHRYTNPVGLGSLLGALVDRVRDRNQIPVDGRRNLLVTAGATGGLYVAVSATLSPGDEILLVAPYWPLIRGTAICARAEPVEVPVLHEPVDPDGLRSALEDRITSRSAAVYVNTPCNPTSTVLGPDHLAAVAELARRHDLWILSDEVYQDYAYAGDHHSIACLAPERTVTVFSFSKAYGMAGYRCGYLVGPASVVALARRVATYVWYAVPTPSQMVAERALELGGPWLERARTAYCETGARAASRLGLRPPEGGTFLFFDVAPHLDERGLLGFLEGCLDDHVILAPGSSFGAAYDTWVRLCFTCVAPDIVDRGVELLARRLGR